MYPPIAQPGPVASPPRTSLLAGSLQLPSSQRRTAPEPPCSVTSQGRYQSTVARSSAKDGIGAACSVVNMSVRTADPDLSDTLPHVPIGCSSEQGTRHRPRTPARAGHESAGQCRLSCSNGGDLGARPPPPQRPRARDECRRMTDSHPSEVSLFGSTGGFHRVDVHRL